MNRGANKREFERVIKACQHFTIPDHLKEDKSLRSILSFIGASQFMYAGIINSLTADEQERNVLTAIYESDNDLKSAIMLLHRTILSQLHSFTSYALDQYCTQNKINVENNLRNSFIKELKGKGIEDINDIEFLLPKHKQFDDYLNASIDYTFNRSNGKKWRKFFKGLSVLRNKVSHHSAKLSKGEEDQIKLANFQNVKLEKKSFSINPKFHWEAMLKVFLFCVALAESDGSIIPEMWNHHP